MLGLDNVVVGEPVDWLKTHKDNVYGKSVK
jgi:hypothetical protein